MAYLKEIATRCDSCRTATAKVELKDRYNGFRGQYCKACGKRELKKLKVQEGQG